MPKTVFVTSSTMPKTGVNLLIEAKLNVIAPDDLKAFTRNEILEKIKGVDAIFWSTHISLDKEVLDAAGPNLKVIGTTSAGYDHIDVNEIKKRGIKLGNTPGVVNDGVANTAILLMLETTRKINETRERINSGMWKYDSPDELGRDIKGSTVGIVGLGEIGKEIVKKLKVFHVAKVLYSNRNENPAAKELGAIHVSFDTLLKESDFVVIACPLTHQTREMFDEEAFKKMKKNAILINIARGGIVDQSALIEALKNKTIFAAGLDVMTPEPLPTDHELIKLSNCVLLPHIGTATYGSRSDMAELTARNIINALNGEPMVTPLV